MREDSSILKVSGLNVKFDGHIILENVSFDVKRDDTLAIIGPNGAGKTVLFRAILGLIPFEGTITWAPDVKIGYVPQRLAVEKDLPLTVREFLSLKENDQRQIDNALREVGFLENASHLHNDLRVLSTSIGDLSGGEFQRVLIAYALLGNPNVLLFDEPTVGVDVAGEETVYSLIHKLQAKSDLTIIFISHELEIVYQHATTALCLNKSEICFGPPKEVVDKKALIKMYGEGITFYKHADIESIYSHHEHHTHHDH